MVAITLLLFAVVGSLSYGESLLICPPQVQSFSIGADTQFYYSCTNEGEEPVLKKCPENQVYWAAKERCTAKVKNIEYMENKAKGSDLETFTTPVLGRTVYLGCLYDAKNSLIMAGDSFWTDDTIKKHKKKNSLFSSIIYTFAARSTFDRFAHMDFDASMKLEFLDGLIKVEGSASFLQDSVESENTVAVIMKAHYNTHSETLPSVTKKDFKYLCNLKGPTHVVTSIAYGMEANFVFKKTAKAEESREQISGSLKIAVKSIPSIKIEGEAHVNISGALKKTVENVEVKLFGDFVLDKQPTTYEESILAFTNLTSHLGKRPEYPRAVKMTMQLTPITRFCDGKDALLVSISNSLIHTLTTMLDEIEKTNLKANTLAGADCVGNYLPLKKIIDTFVNSLNIFQLGVKSDLQRLLPNIRGGNGSGEKDLVELLTKYKNSPFNFHNAESFLKSREREIGMIDYILDPDKFKGTDIQVLDYEAGSDAKILFEKKYVLMMKFNVLPAEDIVDQFLAGKLVDESSSWFNQPKVVAAMGKEFKSFIRFAIANKNSKSRGYLVAMYNANVNFLTVYAQKEGDLLTSHFQFPELPPRMFPIKNSYNSMRFAVDKPSNNFVSSFHVKYWKYGKESGSIEKKFQFTDDATTFVELNGLESNEIYQFSMKYDTAMGSSPHSPKSSPIVTRPSTPPRNLRIQNLTPTSFVILWDPPYDAGAGVQIASYEVTVSRSGFFANKTIGGGDRLARFNHLSPAMTYNITIQANSNPKKYNESEQQKEMTPSSLHTWFPVTTTPNPPETPNVVGVLYNSAEIHWNPPSKVADGAIIQDYHVKYATRYNEGGHMTGESNNIHSSGNKTFANITDLAEGTIYDFSVKVVTSLGTSSFSPVVVVKTKRKQSETDALNESVRKEILLSVTQATGKIDNNLGAIQSDIQKKSERFNDNVHKFTSDLQVGSSGISLVKSELAETLQVHYLQYGAYLEGIGYPKHYSGKFDVRAATTVACVLSCHGKRHSDSTVNGLVFDFSMKKCSCLRHARGHKSKGKLYHYRFK